jgi:hypothetical protein
MTTKEFVALEKLLLPNLPKFVIKGRLLFIAPIERTLRGFHFDPSAFSKKDFYVAVFFMPLCVPMKQVHFTFGHRVGPGWSADDPGLKTILSSAMQKELPFLANLKTATDVAEALKPLTKGSNPHCHEALAYTLVQAGEIRAAVDAIDTLLRLVDSVKRVNPDVTWELQIAERAQSLKTKLMANPEEANAQLAAWESETVRNLGLGMFWNQAHRG